MAAESKQKKGVCLFAYNKEENRWIYAFLKGINTKGNANQLI